MKLRILIAGAGGQLGQCLRQPLAKHDLVCLDHAALDITSMDRVAEALSRAKPDLVINAAAFNDVDGAQSRPAEAYAVNALGPRNLACATAARRIPILQVSTDYVFNGDRQTPYHELDRTNPISVYGASKLAGEAEVRRINACSYIVRTAWLYWERGNNFLLRMLRNAGRSEIRVVSDLWGSPTYVPHLADGIAQLITTGAYGTYHMAGQGQATRWELVGELFRVMRIETAVRPASSKDFELPARRPVYSVLTTIMEPHIELPPWHQGVIEFAANQGCAV